MLMLWLHLQGLQAGNQEGGPWLPSLYLCNSRSRVNLVAIQLSLNIACPPTGVSISDEYRGQNYLHP